MCNIVRGSALRGTRALLAEHLLEGSRQDIGLGLSLRRRIVTATHVLMGSSASSIAQTICLSEVSVHFERTQLAGRHGSRAVIIFTKSLVSATIVRLQVQIDVLLVGTVEEFTSDCLTGEELEAFSCCKFLPDDLFPERVVLRLSGVNHAT